MSESVPKELIAEIKQFIVLNLEYETGEHVFERRNFLGFASGAMAPAYAALSSFQLMDIMDKRERSFSDELNDLVRRSGRKPSDVYNRAQINRQLYSRICNDPKYRPKKITALALAIALELTLEQTKAFIARAGYALTRSSVTDLVVEFFINRKIYDVIQINAVLDELDEPILGSVAREDLRHV